MMLMQYFFPGTGEAGRVQYKGQFGSIQLWCGESGGHLE